MRSLPAGVAGRATVALHARLADRAHLTSGADVALLSRSAGEALIARLALLTLPAAVARRTGRTGGALETYTTNRATSVLTVCCYE